MKKELGDWTRRFFLCLSFSSSAGGFRRSMSFWSTCTTAPESKKIRTVNPTKIQTREDREIEQWGTPHHAERLGFARAPRSQGLQIGRAHV